VSKDNLKPEKNHTLDPGAVRAMVHRHLLELGFSKNGQGYFVKGDLSKAKIRQLHSAHRQEVLVRNRAFLEERGHQLVKHFADGHEIDPERIDPELVEITAGTADADLFRFATLLWSVPVSQGFGRRMRFLVRDRQNNRLIGLFALGDPVFNLSARDTWVGWTHADRSQRLVHVMDAYVVGSVPPYSRMIGGKLVAALLASREVRDVYNRKYVGRESVIAERENRARLVLLTTTSALGRSSLYNRLSVPDGPRFIRIGETKGYGHFHLSGDVFETFRAYLEAAGHPYASGHRFGMGPNWKIRVARAALEALGIEGNAVLKHGVRREVYAVPLADNFREILMGKHVRVRSSALTVDELADYCRRRWITPRAHRDKSYRHFRRGELVDIRPTPKSHAQ
jgi:hypothetical protein